MPFSAPRPVLTITAIGVARPRASGQAITNTVIVNVTASNSVSPITQNHTPKVTRPITIAAITSHCAALSAKSCAGALEFCASCTSFTIWARAESAPTLVALYWKVPLLLMVAPITVAPGPFCTGIDSPVSMDSSTSESPVSMTPSTGILPPGRMTTISPARTSAVGTSTSAPLRITCALAGVKFISALIAEDAPARARISSQCPSRMNTSRTAAASKNCPPPLKKKVLPTLNR